MTRFFRAGISTAAVVLLAATSASTRGASAAPRAREVVEITAERFNFTPSEIRVKKGTTLEIRLRSEDTDHGFHIVGTKTDVRIPKRNKGQITVTFDAAEPGRHTFQCSHVCGAGHSFMRGTIVVTE